MTGGMAENKRGDIRRRQTGHRGRISEIPGGEETVGAGAGGSD